MTATLKVTISQKLSTLIVDNSSKEMDMDVTTKLFVKKKLKKYGISQKGCKIDT